MCKNIIKKNTITVFEKIAYNKDLHASFTAISLAFLISCSRFEHDIVALACKCALLCMPLLHAQNLTNLRGLEAESPHLIIVKVDVEWDHDWDLRLV